jgi:hypothetical protein
MGIPRVASHAAWGRAMNVDASFSAGLHCRARGVVGAKWLAARPLRKTGERARIERSRSCSRVVEGRCRSRHHVDGRHLAQHEVGVSSRSAYGRCLGIVFGSRGRESARGSRGRDRGVRGSVGSGAHGRQRHARTRATRRSGWVHRETPCPPVSLSRDASHGKRAERKLRRDAGNT